MLISKLSFIDAITGIRAMYKGDVEAGYNPVFLDSVLLAYSYSLGVCFVVKSND